MARQQRQGHSSAWSRDTTISVSGAVNRCASISTLRRGAGTLGPITISAACLTISSSVIIPSALVFLANGEGSVSHGPVGTRRRGRSCPTVASRRPFSRLRWNGKRCSWTENRKGQRTLGQLDQWSGSLLCRPLSPHYLPRNRLSLHITTSRRRVACAGRDGLARATCQPALSSREFVWHVLRVSRPCPALGRGSMRH